MRHLLFQIAAPLASFGSAGAKQERATDGHPSKAFALGFLGCALGKKREDPWHSLCADFGFAVLTVKPGVRVEDYHTVATPRGTDQYATRREEVAQSDYTVETYREYLCDAYFVIALWNSTGAGFILDEYQEALICPVFELFAGRKSCPLSLPPAPIMIESETLASAFKDYYRCGLYEPLRPEGIINLDVHWESHPNAGITLVETYLRKDQVVSRAKRLYRERTELSGFLEFGA